MFADKANAGTLCNRSLQRPTVVDHPFRSHSRCTRPQPRLDLATPRLQECVVVLGAVFIWKQRVRCHPPSVGLRSLRTRTIGPRQCEDARCPRKPSAKIAGTLNPSFMHPRHAVHPTLVERVSCVPRCLVEGLKTRNTHFAEPERARKCEQLTL